MREICFITGNKGKLSEARRILDGVKQIKMDLPEIQEIDAKKVIEEKLRVAIKNSEGEIFCEDTSLYISCLNGLPGPLIKWFSKSMGNSGIFDLVNRYDDRRAVAKTIVGYSDGGDIRFFEGEIEGEIVSPRGENGIGWDKLFIPNGHKRTFGEMTMEEKNKLSMRNEALMKLKIYLDKKRGENEFSNC